jgi:hypothetical protein
LYQPQMIMDDDECGAIAGMLGRENWSTWRKPTLVPFVCHKSHLTWLGLEPGPPPWEDTQLKFVIQITVLISNMKFHQTRFRSLHETSKMNALWSGHVHQHESHLKP